MLTPHQQPELPFKEEDRVGSILKRMAFELGELKDRDARQAYAAIGQMKSRVSDLINKVEIVRRIRATELRRES